MQFSVMALADTIQTEADAYRFVETLRWGADKERQACPHCGATNRLSFLTPKDGTEARKTRTGSSSQRRVWFCGHCRRQFTVLVGTIFHGTKVPLRKWLFVVYEMCANKNGIAAREIQRKYEVTPKTAWFMAHRVREGMKRDPFASALRGVVMADETFIGADPENKHRSDFPKGPTYGPGSRKARGTGKDNMTAVLSLIDKSTGEVRSQVVPNIRGNTLRKAIAKDCDMSQTILHTDGLKSYQKIAHEFADHECVDHSAGEYVRGDVTTNHVEGYFSQLKRSLDGTHHHVSVEHLPRYLAEFDFRYSTRDMTDDARTKRLFGQVGGRRITYKRTVVGQFELGPARRLRLGPVGWITWRSGRRSPATRTRWPRPSCASPPTPTIRVTTRTRERTRPLWSLDAGVAVLAAKPGRTSSPRNSGPKSRGVQRRRAGHGLSGMRTLRAIASTRGLIDRSTDLHPVERPQPPQALPLPRSRINVDNRQAEAL